MRKENYEGLGTRRFGVECCPIMATSTARVKVKTEKPTTPWEDVEPEDALSTSITAEHSF